MVLAFTSRSAGGNTTWSSLPLSYIKGAELNVAEDSGIQQHSEVWVTAKDK